MSSTNNSRSLSRIESLPGDIIIHIFGEGYLTARDIIRCMRLSHSIANWFEGTNGLLVQILDWGQLQCNEDLLERGKDWDNRMLPTTTTATPTTDYSMTTLLYQFQRWDVYRKALVERLPTLVQTVSEDFPSSFYSCKGDDMLCQRFLTGAISRFRDYVCNAHPWYEHLPLCQAYQLDFYFDITSNMRQDRDGNWTDIVEEDDVRLDGTWITTFDYRSKFGYFDYCCCDPRPIGDVVTGTISSSSSSDNTKDTKDGCVELFSQKVYPGSVYYPRSFRSQPVYVTAAFYKSSLRHYLYNGILEDAIDKEDANRVTEALTYGRIMCISSSSISPNQYLPAEAATDLKKIASFLLKEDVTYDELKELVLEFGTDDDPPDNYDYRAWSNFALRAQSQREHKAITIALYELCLHTYGPRLTPSRADVMKRFYEDTKISTIHWNPSKHI